jgi:hypothetical protein
LYCMCLSLHLGSEYKQSDIGRNHVLLRAHFCPFPLAFQ